MENKMKARCQMGELSNENQAKNNAERKGKKEKKERIDMQN